MELPNLLYPIDFLSRLQCSSARCSTLAAVVSMPGYFLPQSESSLSAHEVYLRVHFWVSAMMLEFGLVVLIGTLVLRILAQRKQQSLLQQSLLGQPMQLLGEEGDSERVWQIGDRIEICNTGAWKGTVVENDPLTIQLDTGGIIDGYPEDGMIFVGEGVDIIRDRMRSRARVIVGLHCATCTILTLAAAMTDRLSPKSGLPWEGYFAMMTLGSLWCLAQAAGVYLFRVTKETQYPTLAFGMGMVATVLPFASDAFDTLKDIQLGALCLLPDTPFPLKVVGVISILRVYIFHELLLRDDDMLGEVAGTYFAIYATAAQTPEDAVEGVEFLSEDKQTQLCVLASKQTSPEKRRWLLKENLPQVVFLAIYLHFMGLHLLPIVSAAGFPIIQYLVAHIFHDTFRKGAFANTYNNFLKLANASEVNTAHLGKLKSTFLADNAALLKYSETILDPSQKKLFRSAADKLKRKGDFDISTFFSMLDAREQLNLAVRTDILPMVVEFIEDNKTITDITLHNSAKHTATIIRALKSNHTLLRIDISGNCLGKEASVHIADFLKENTTLQVLGLSNNYLGTEGVLCILEALKVNQALANIDISGNELGTEAGFRSAEVLSVNTSLMEINIEKNNIGAQGAAAIALALQTRVGQFKLWVDGADIERPGRLCIADALKVNAGLTVNLLWSSLRVQDPLMEPYDSRPGVLSLGRPAELQDYYDS